MSKRGVRNDTEIIITTTRAIIKNDNLDNFDNIAYDGNCRLRGPRIKP